MTQKSTNTPILYEVWIDDAVAHLFKVRLTLKSSQKQQRFRLPQWIPGSYMIRNFARHIVEMHAFDGDGHPVEVTKRSGFEWQANNASGELVLEYRVYAWDLSVRGAHLDQTHAFFNGTSLFLEVEGLSDHACRLLINRPGEDYASNWRVATSMPSAKESIDESQLFGAYECEDYQDLIDHPVEIGDLTVEAFSVKGIPHEIAFYGKHEADTKRIVRDLKPICEKQIELFGGLPDCVEKYVFLVTVLGDGYGGLEHRSSTALHCSRKDLPKPGDDGLSDDYINFLTLCSHEYFHTWNIKQIKPENFLPYDLSQEAYTQQLWIFEGFTSYFEDRLVYEAGVINQSQYLKLIAQVMTRVHRGKGRQLQSVAESSFDAWTRFYLQDENAPNAIVSYYTKGKLIALCLDLLIREQTDNQQSLSDVMRYLWQNYGQPKIGLGEQELETILKETFELDLQAFIQSAVYSTDELPIAQLLEKANVRVEWHSVEQYKTLSAEESKTKVNLGAMVKPNPVGAEIVVVYHNSNAHRAGLSTGDVVIAVNGLKVDAQNIESIIASRSPGDTVTLHSFRRDELMVQTFELVEAEKNTCCLSATNNNEPAILWL